MLLPAAIFYPALHQKAEMKASGHSPHYNNADPPPRNYCSPEGGCFCPSGGGERRVYTAWLTSCLAVIIAVRRG